MLSKKEIICPKNLLEIAKKKGPAKAVIVNAGKKVAIPNHPIQGGGYNMSNLKFLDGVPVDGFIQISGEEAQKTTRDLAKHEGIFGGFSSGANVAAALKLLSEDMAGKTIVIIICDSGLKYLSTDLWNE